MNSSISKSWNNRDKLLKKFIGSDLDDEIEIGAEAWSRHRDPRLSIKAQ